MTHFRTMYDAEYLGHWDIPEGRDVTVTIAEVKGGELVAQGGRKSRKPIISFVGKEKKFISNVTNSKAIAGMYGPHVEHWKGKKITLYVSTTRDPSTGGETPCLRVRPRVSSAAQSTPSSSAESAGAAPAEEVSDEGAPI
jgi:hypothetical protein